MKLPSVNQLLATVKSDFRIRLHEADRDIEFLLAHTLGVETMDMNLCPDRVLTESELQHFNGFMERRASFEPTWYITGKAPFWKHEFLVNKNTMIPRKETEFLLESIIKELEGIRGPVRAIEAGCGSGNICLSLANDFPDIEIISFDCSREALEVAEMNRKKLHIENVTFILTQDFSVSGQEPFDLFFSNPPYIKTGDIDRLQPEIKHFEPVVALDGGPDGLSFYRIISKNVRNYLKPGSKIFLEIGFNQKNDVIAIFEEQKIIYNRSEKDYSGNHRILVFSL